MRYYYTDGIKAAYMAREFNFQMQVKVLKDFDSVEYVDKILNLDCAPMDVWWLQNFPPKLCKYFIHPDCHDMLKPQVGDLVKIDGEEEYQLINYDAELFDIRHGCEEIIQRNGIAFFTPEEE